MEHETGTENPIIIKTENVQPQPNQGNASSESEDMPQWARKMMETLESLKPSPSPTPTPKPEPQPEKTPAIPQPPPPPKPEPQPQPEKTKAGVLERIGRFLL